MELPSLLGEHSGFSGSECGASPEDPGVQVWAPRRLQLAHMEDASPGSVRAALECWHRSPASWAGQEAATEDADNNTGASERALVCAGFWSAHLCFALIGSATKTLQSCPRGAVTLDWLATLLTVY